MAVIRKHCAKPNKLRRRGEAGTVAYMKGEEGLIPLLKEADLIQLSNDQQPPEEMNRKIASRISSMEKMQRDMQDKMEKNQEDVERKFGIIMQSMSEILTNQSNMSGTGGCATKPSETLQLLVPNEGNNGGRNTQQNRAPYNQGYDKPERIQQWCRKRSDRKKRLFGMGVVLQTITMVLEHACGCRPWIFRKGRLRRELPCQTANNSMAVTGRFFRINLTSIEINVPLVICVPDADMEKLTDAWGSGVMWPSACTFLDYA